MLIHLIESFFIHIHLAEQMDGKISCTVALFHDVVEDISITFDDLEKKFPKQMLEIV